MIVEIEMSITASPKTQQVMAKLADFDNIVAGIVREAIADSVLKAIRNRISGRIEHMATYVEDTAAVDETKRSPKQIERLKFVREALTTAHGQRRFSILGISRLITDPAHIHEIRSRNSMSFHTGNISLLDSLDSPSATPIISGHPSTSPYTILWRQMEFGTGLYSKYTGSLTTTPYSTDRGWWYGPRNPYRGIHYKGTRPGNFLRTASGLPYTQDYQRFNRLFAQKLRQQLRG